MRRAAFIALVQVPLCAAALLLLGACAAPEHSNTLIFGTTTKFALDVSQDPTGAVGVTLGYRRQEAVWMPLLPNQGKAGERAPAGCRNMSDCPKFVGEDGVNRDTYSVFASFGGSGSAGAGAAEAGAEGKVQIVQYFATGLAARRLAEGGAALVSTSADPLTSRLSPAQRAEILSQVDKAKAQAQTFATAVSTDGKVDKAKLDKAIGESKLPPDSGLAKLMQASVGQPSAALAASLSRQSDTEQFRMLMGGK